jgi:hypothetical protein
VTIAARATAALRCSAWARAAGLDPIGSAGSYHGFLLIEMPLPWPRDIGEIPAIAALRDVVADAGLRVQALIPEGSRRRVIAYVNPTADGFSGYSRAEAEYGSDLARAVTTVLGEATQGSADAGRDLLVCTHGRRDVCCGSLGTDLSSQLGQTPLPDGVRPWRTSHTGGHRFAPTFIVLPEGTAWAYADADLVDRVLRRRGDAAEVADHYRGCAGLAGPAVQALEREVLRQAGWAVLGSRRRSTTGEDGRTQLIVERSDGATDVWEGLVEPGRRMPVPDCGRPIAEAGKSETEWVVRDVRRR